MKIKTVFIQLWRRKLSSCSKAKKKKVLLKVKAASEHMCDLKICRKEKKDRSLSIYSWLSLRSKSATGDRL